MIKLLKALLPFRAKRRVKDHLGVPSLHRTLRHLKTLGFIPKKAIDIGAYEGDWTKDFLEVFPDTQVLMVEGQEKKTVFLKAIKDSQPQVDYSINILSSQDRLPVHFNEDETNSSITTREPGDEVSMTKLARSLDGLLSEINFGTADFLKLDVQGHELEVLKGGLDTLHAASFCLLEITLIDLGHHSPLFAEVIAFMDEQDFQLYDIAQFMRRPYDKALYQVDALFIKKQHPFLKEKRWN